VAVQCVVIASAQNDNKPIAQNKNIRRIFSLTAVQRFPNHRRQTPGSLAALQNTTCCLQVDWRCCFVRSCTRVHFLGGCSGSILQRFGILHLENLFHKHSLGMGLNGRKINFSSPCTGRVRIDARLR